MKEKDILFRVDAGQDVGYGHLKRCLVLAERIRKIKKGTNAIFITRPEPEAIDIIRKKSFEVTALNKKDEIKQISEVVANKKIKAIIVDLKHPVAAEYVLQLKNMGLCTVIIGNSGSARLVSDMVVYPGIIDDSSLLEGIKGRLYYGPEYAIVSQAFFRENAKKKKAGKNKKTRILVSMGGSDATNKTAVVISELKRIKQDFECVIVLGPGFRNKESVRTAIEGDKRFVIKNNLESLAGIMLSSDVGIILFGVLVYEAAAAKLPCIIMADKHNFKSLKNFQEFKTGIPIIGGNQYIKKLIGKKIEQLINNKGLREKLINNTRKLRTGSGTNKFLEALVQK